MVTTGVEPVSQRGFSPLSFLQPFVNGQGYQAMLPMKIKALLFKLARRTIDVAPLKGRAICSAFHPRWRNQNVVWAKK